MTTTETAATDHKQLGMDLFNKVWEYLDMADRSVEDDDAMLHAAHASRHHWGQIGAPVNLARGEWQIARVYATLGRSEPAIHHARRSLDVCQANGIADFDLAFAYEALARGYSVAGNKEETAKNLKLGYDAAETVADKDDKDWTLQNLNEIKASV